MSAADNEFELNQSRIGRLVKLGADDIQQKALEFARKSEALQQSGEMAAAHRLKQEREGATRQQEAASLRLKREAEAAAAAEAALEEMRAHRGQLQSKVVEQGERRLAGEATLRDLEKKAEGADPDELKRLHALVALADRLSSQKSDFKKQCARQLAAWQAELASLESANASTVDEEGAKLAEIERLHAAEEAKAMTMRRLVGQKGRQAASLAREVDDVPSSAELMQYERRFRELYGQVASKLTETKRYFALYNTLEEQKGYLTKEVSLLNSIHENYSKAATGSAKDKIADSVEGLNSSVQQNLAKAQQRLQEERSSRDAAQAAYDKLVEAQRRYFQLVKAYQLECQKNEEMAAQITATGG